MVTPMIPPIIAPSRPGGVGDNRPCHRTNQTAGNSSTGRPARQPADKRAGAATDQCATEHAILPSVRTPRER
jgi:hypothetical protein